MMFMIRKLKSLIGQRSWIRMTYHHGKAFFAALRFGFPARKLTLIGITGTDGKTTTVGMVSQILLHTGQSYGAASTAFYDINGSRQENTTHLTSLTPWDLQKFLRALVRECCQYAVVEMSSHGLVQGRCNYTWPTVSAITNTSMESLEYHKTMEQYRKDKGIIFKLLRGKGTKVLNGCDESFPMYVDIPSEKTIVFGVGLGNVGNLDHLGSLGNLRAVFSLKGMSGNAEKCSASLVVTENPQPPTTNPLPPAAYPLSLTIPGLFNLENAMTAIACTSAIDISIGDAVEAVRDFQSMPGRLERIDEGQEFQVFVDFTMTPQAYEKTLLTLREAVKDNGRVLALCSCCGNRMKEKRPVIGRVCSKLADVVVACGDETYGEDPHAVLEELWAGVDQSQCEAEKIYDRREAITTLISKAQPGDAVILCGMGPFEYMSTLEGTVPWDEREVAREVLRAL